MWRRRPIQSDEKWAFVAEKEKDCDPDDPADDRHAGTWDHVALDAESRMVIGVVPGERTAESVVAVVEDLERRTGGRLMDLITIDGDPASEEAILEAHGGTFTPPRTGKRGRELGDRPVDEVEAEDPVAVVDRAEVVAPTVEAHLSHILPVAPHPSAPWHPGGPIPSTDQAWPSGCEVAFRGLRGLTGRGCTPNGRGDKTHPGPGARWPPTHGW